MFYYISITEPQNITIFLFEVGNDKPLWDNCTTDTYKCGKFLFYKTCTAQGAFDNFDLTKYLFAVAAKKHNSRNTNEA